MRSTNCLCFWIKLLGLVCDILILKFSSFYRKGKKPILILRTQLSVRVHSILGKSVRTVLLYDEHMTDLQAHFIGSCICVAEVASTSSLAFHSGCWFSLSWRKQKWTTFSKNAEMVLSLYSFSPQLGTFQLYPHNPQWQLQVQLASPCDLGLLK